MKSNEGKRLIYYFCDELEIKLSRTKWLERRNRILLLNKQQQNIFYWYSNRNNCSDSLSDQLGHWKQFLSKGPNVGSHACFLENLHRYSRCAAQKKRSRWYPASGFQKECLIDPTLDQYLKQKTTFSNAKIFMSKGIVQVEEERNCLNVFQQ